MAKLRDDIKTFIVMELAMFETPSEVAAAVKEEYGIVVSRQQVHHYNPTGSDKAKVAKAHKALFEATRKTFLKDTAAIPIAQRAFRLRRLDRMARKAESQGNRPLAAQLMEQAAKECGNAYTNRHELTGRNGKPLIPEQALTVQQIDARIMARLGKAKPAPAG